MLVKTTVNNWSLLCCPVDDVIGIQLTNDELIEKKKVFGDWGGDDYFYFGDSARVIYYFFQT
jgi:hypothetical protein